MSETYLPVKSTFKRLGNMGNALNTVLYEPEGAASDIGVLIMHSDGDYLAHTGGCDLAARGFKTLCANTTPGKPLDQKLLQVKQALDYLKTIDGVKKTVVLGHSGGATLMSAYQAVAENGVQIFQGEQMIVKCGDIGPLTPADGVMFLDSNFGNGAMTLLSVDPAVTDDEDGRTLDPAYDLTNPAVGYKPEGAAYDDNFVLLYQRAQGERNNRIIDKALERLAAIERGEGHFKDDEPFLVAGAAQFGPCNRLFPQDIRYIAHTKGEWPLLHADGSETVEVVHSVRRPRPARAWSDTTEGMVRTTVREYLASRAVRALPDYGYDATGVYGIDWDSSFCCTPGNVRFIHAPALLMGMTAGYEFVAAELLHSMIASEDKTLAFVEGATHGFQTAKDCEAYPGQFGDTVKTLFDYVAKWLRAGHV